MCRSTCEKNRAMCRTRKYIYPVQAGSCDQKTYSLLDSPRREKVLVSHWIIFHILSTHADADAFVESTFSFLSVSLCTLSLFGDILDLVTRRVETVGFQLNSIKIKCTPQHAGNRFVNFLNLYILPSSIHCFSIFVYRFRRFYKKSTHSDRTVSTLRLLHLNCYLKVNLWLRMRKCISHCATLIIHVK